MDEGQSLDRKRKWFGWGLVLAWVPSIPFVIAMVLAFRRGISEQKATGLGAVAGGLAEVYVTVGLALTLLLPVVAIVLLIRSFSGAQWGRATLSLLSIGWSLVILLLCGLSIWGMISLQFHR